MNAGPHDQPRYELLYWPFIQGRGEFIRLVFEEAGAPYLDVARLPESEGGGVASIMKALAEGARPVPFAPPILRYGDLLLWQTPNILAWLAPRLSLCPTDEAGRLAAHAIMLTVADFVTEIHDVHHPIGVGLYYEDQKPEALRTADCFARDRMPKFLTYFERLLKDNAASAGATTVGTSLSYVDLALFQLMAGLKYAFPKTLATLKPALPRLTDLAARVAARPRIAAYLASPRRIPFNQKGIFRHYPELDQPGGSKATAK
jgi:glutathione S-transferase